MVLSRPGRHRVGWLRGCARGGRESFGAAVAVSIHADSTAQEADQGEKEAPHDRADPARAPTRRSTACSGEGRKASNVMRDAFVKAGFPAATRGGRRKNNDRPTRSDIAAVNLTKVPAVFIEMGNLSNPGRAASLSERKGQLEYSMAITDGILNYVRRRTTSVPGNRTPTTPHRRRRRRLRRAATERPRVGDPVRPTVVGRRGPPPSCNCCSGRGRTSAAQVLKAMLTVIYGLFGGKLPIG